VAPWRHLSFVRIKAFVIMTTGLTVAAWSQAATVTSR